MIPPMIQMAYTVIITSIYTTTNTNIITEIIPIAILVLSNQSNIYAPHSGHSVSQVQGVWLQAGHSASLQLGCVHLLLIMPQGQVSLI